jgi:hypothetical protein
MRSQEVILFAPSDERMGLSFITAAGPCQRSHTRGRVPRDCPQDNPSAQTPRKTLSYVVKNAYLLACYLAMDLHVTIRIKALL